MRRALRTVLVVAALAAAAAPLPAQQAPPGLIAQDILLVVQPDHFAHFEEALRTHLGFHRSNQDPWAWHTWQIVNGDNIGHYHLRTHGHRWQDLDSHAEMRRSDWADFLVNVAPHLQSMTSRLTSVEPDISNWPAASGRPRMVAVSRIAITYQGIREFRDAIEQIHAALASAAPDRHYAWTTTVNGSNGPEMTLLVPLSGWADLEPRQPPLWALIEAASGAERAAALRETIGNTVRSIQTSVVAYREDLSYTPESP